MMWSTKKKQGLRTSIMK